MHDWCISTRPTMSSLVPHWFEAFLVTPVGQGKNWERYIALKKVTEWNTARKTDASGRTAIFASGSLERCRQRQAPTCADTLNFVSSGSTAKTKMIIEKDTTYVCLYKVF